MLELLRSPLNGERLTALLLLVGRHGRGSAAERNRIYKEYPGNTRFVNRRALVASPAQFSRKPLFNV